MKAAAMLSLRGEMGERGGGGGEYEGGGGRGG